MRVDLLLLLSIQFCFMILVKAWEITPVIKRETFIFKNRMADSAYLKILLIHLCYVWWLTCVITLDTYSWGSNKFRNVKSVVAIETTFVMKIRWSGKEKTISFPTFPFFITFYLHAYKPHLWSRFGLTFLSFFKTCPF